MTRGREWRREERERERAALERERERTEGEKEWQSAAAGGFCWLGDGARS
jgi:hypothetical protein